jgi:hypothetical protein
MLTERKLTLLEHIDKILEFSKEGVDGAFLENAQVHINAAAKELNVPPVQAVLFAHVFDISLLGSRRAHKEDSLFESLKCSKVKYLEYLNELDELIRKNYIIQDLNGGDNSYPTYRLPRDFILALRKNKPICPETYSNLPIKKLFNVLNKTFKRRYNNELILNDLSAILDTLVNENKHLKFIQKIIEYKLDIHSRNLLIYFCSNHINHDENVNTMDIRNQFSDEDDDFDVEWCAISLLKNEDHVLQRKGFIENVNEQGFALSEEYQLTKKAKDDLFSELRTKKQVNKKDFVLAADISEKTMFYNEGEEKNIRQLAGLLTSENYNTVTERLESKGLRKGFACLFSGSPGTGKTETVYQIARQTKRDIMPVDVSQIKSKWVGDSEKNIREVFTRYKSHVEDSDNIPILLFNEADAILGRRVKITESSRSVDQMENSIQNIILEEIEKLEGILIATTNLTGNLDKAFERRFIYKIEFEKPSLDARKSIWKSLMPDLPETEAEILAERFCFSGGQIENIARKRTIETVLSGKEPSLDTLIMYCKDEFLEKETAKIGFVA